MMADSIFPSLRIAFSQALGGIRSGFGRIKAPAKQKHPEPDGFLTRLEEVLGIELQEAEPALHPQEFAAEQAVAIAQHLKPVPTTQYAVRTQPITQPAIEPSRKSEAAEKTEPTEAATAKTVTGKKRTGKSAHRGQTRKRRS